MSGCLYRLTVSEPAAFRAAGMDAAYRVQRRVNAAICAVLADDREVIEVEDELWLRVGLMPCDGSKSCRGALHNRDCARWNA